MLTDHHDDDVDHSVADDIKQRITTSRAEADDAERIAVQIMQELGYRDAKQTPKSADNGRDIVAKGAIAEVKWQAKPAGRPEAQKLGGVLLREQRRFRRDQKMFFFSKSGFSPQAVAYANDVGMALFEFDMEGKARAANKHAEPYRKQHPSIVIGNAAPKPPGANRLRNRIGDLAIDILVGLVLLICALIPLAAVGFGSFLIYLGIDDMISGSVGVGAGITAVGLLLIAVAVSGVWQFFRWAAKDEA